MSLLLYLVLLAARAEPPERPTTCVITATDATQLRLQLTLASAGTGVICLEPGDYTAPSGGIGFSISSDVTLVGLGSAPEDVVLRQESTSDWVVDVDGATATLHNLTIDGSGTHRAMATSGNSRLILVDVTVRNGWRSGEGAGIRQRANNHLEIYRSTFRNNLCLAGNGRGGHLYHSGGSGTIYVEDSHFEVGVALRGGAFAIEDGALTVMRSAFVENRSTQVTGNNEDIWGGGALNLMGGTHHVERSTFLDNSAESKGGAILVRGNGTTLDLFENTFESGEATYMGGHVAAVDRAQLRVERNRFFEGSGAGGGAIGCYNATCSVHDSGFWSNESRRDGSERRGGGAIFHRSDNQNRTLTATHNLFCQNRMVAAPSDGDNGTGGGALLTKDTRAYLDYNVYVGNTTNRAGGAVHFRNDRNGVGGVGTYETYIANRAEQGCSVFGRNATTHLVSHSLYTLSGCYELDDPIAEPRGSVLHANNSNELRTEDVVFWDLDLAQPMNGNVDHSGEPVFLDPGLSDFPGQPLPEDYDCRNEYDLFEPFAGLDDPPLVGHLAGPDAGFIDDDGDGWSWLFDCDDDDPRVQGPGPYYPDGDGDGFGDARATPAGEGCPPPGFVTNNLDCDDTNPNVNPDADEIVANGRDDNCDGTELCYLDMDRDGFRSDETVQTEDLTCTEVPHALASVPDGDCDDTDATVYPGADEICDGQFNDCDAAGYDLSGAPAAESDGDSDGFVACDYEGGTWIDNVISTPSVGQDCDDTDATVFPGAPEIWYDGVDQSCDGWSDFDPDRDGQIWPDYAARDEAFFAALGIPTTTEGAGDCYDGEDTPLQAREGWQDPDPEQPWDPE
ncbi:MAG: hypothetical protein EA397_20585, partial [Deltaproteobacteria bacterium]